MNAESAFMVADWAIVGGETPEGVQLVATRSLRPGGSCEPRSRDAGPSRLMAGQRAYVPDGWHIELVADDVANVTAPTYGEALTLLMGLWEAQDSPVAELFRASGR